MGSMGSLLATAGGHLQSLAPHEHKLLRRGGASKGATIGMIVIIVLLALAIAFILLFTYFIRRQCIKHARNAAERLEWEERMGANAGRRWQRDHQAARSQAESRAAKETSIEQEEQGIGLAELARDGQNVARQASYHRPARTWRGDMNARPGHHASGTPNRGQCVTPARAPPATMVSNRGRDIAPGHVHTAQHALARRIDPHRLDDVDISAVDGSVFVVGDDEEDPAPQQRRAARAAGSGTTTSTACPGSSATPQTLPSQPRHNGAPVPPRSLASRPMLQKDQRQGTNPRPGPSVAQSAPIPRKPLAPQAQGPIVRQGPNGGITTVVAPNPTAPHSEHGVLSQVSSLRPSHSVASSMASPRQDNRGGQRERLRAPGVAINERTLSQRRSDFRRNDRTTPALPSNVPATYAQALLAGHQHMKPRPQRRLSDSTVSSGSSPSVCGQTRPVTAASDDGRKDEHRNDALTKLEGNGGSTPMTKAEKDAIKAKWDPRGSTDSSGSQDGNERPENKLVDRTTEIRRKMIASAMMTAIDPYRLPEPRPVSGDIYSATEREVSQVESGSWERIRALGVEVDSRLWDRDTLSLHTDKSSQRQ